MKYSLALFFFLFFLIQCKTEEVTESLASCDQSLYNLCNNSPGEFCTFGLKWGNNNSFANPGLEKPGPGIRATEISYKFEGEGITFSTHSQKNLKSESFDRLPVCAKQKMREAFAMWENVADIKFIEKVGTEKSDIRLITAEISQGGIGYPPFQGSPCTEIAGMVVINSRRTYTCDNLLYLCLHEIGHVLGLGHVKSNNVMDPDKVYYTLQSGDIKGIQSIYGKK